MSEVTSGLKIRFSEHITQSYREGIISEIVEVATAEQIDNDSYLIRVLKPKWYSAVVGFLRKEELIGNLELDEFS